MALSAIAIVLASVALLLDLNDLYEARARIAARHGIPFRLGARGLAMSCRRTVVVTKAPQLPDFWRHSVDTHLEMRPNTWHRPRGPGFVDC